MRRLIAGSPPKQENKQPAPLEKENSKRRAFSFLAYSPDRRSNTDSTRRRMREQHKQIANVVGRSQSMEQDAVEIHAFPITPDSKRLPPENRPVDSFALAHGNTGSTYTMLETPKVLRQPKRSPLEIFVEQHQGTSRTGSLVSGFSEGRNMQATSKSVNSMPTFPSNSSMNARNYLHSSSASTSTNISAGAAARRRARRQQEPSGINQDIGLGHQQRATPPPSPYPINRILSNTSASSRSSHGKTHTNHLTNYAQTPRATIGHSSPNASVNSFVSNETSLFKSNFDQGFSFDAFGLDEHLVNEEVSRAIQELQSTSLFYQEEFPPQSFDSPPGSYNGESRCGTPVDEDGFENGFRVTVPNMASASPHSSDRSSLTESTDKKDAPGRSNMFKEQAGWSGSHVKRIPPSDANWADFGKYRTSPPSLPEFKGFKSGVMNRSEAGIRSDFGAPSSTGAPSDIAIQSDVGVNSQVMMGLGEEQLEIPMEVMGKKSKKSRDLYDEKKDEVSAVLCEKPVALLKKQWEYSNSSKQEEISTPRHRSNPETWQSKSTQSSSPASLRSVNKEQKSEQHKRVQECAQQRTSLSSHRERLKPSHLRQDLKSTKSDVGGPLRSNPELNSVLNRVRGYGHTEASPAETRSDTGQPAFLSGVKLRSTGGVSKFESPRNQNHHNQYNGDTWQDDDSDQQDDNQYDPSCPYEIEKRMSLRKGRRETEPVQQEHNNVRECVQEPQILQPKKLSYREVRELHLREQQEKERQNDTEKGATKEIDVAALIRKRIAANKQKASMINESDTFGVGKPVTPIQVQLKKVSMESKITQFRAPVEKERNEVSPFGMDQVKESQTTYPTSTKENRDHVAERIEHTKLHKVNPKVLEILSPSLNHRPSESPVNDVVLSSIPKASLAVANLFVSRSQTVGPPPTHCDPQQKQVEVFQQESISASAADTKSQLNAFFANRLAEGPKLDLPNQHSEDEAALAMRRSNKESNMTTSVMTSSHTDIKLAIPVVNDASKLASPSGDMRPSLKNDPKYDRYFRMLKVGMPLDVVKHAMTQDGVDPSVMNGDHNKPAGFGSGPSLMDDPKYTKYFKMLKMGLPMGAVQNAMERDGIDASVMERDHTLPATVNGGGSGEGQPQTENVPKDTHRRTRLHWDTLRKVRSNSLWAKINQDEELEDIDIDEEEFAQLFQAELAPTQGSKARSGISSKRGAAVRVIDSKRANNGGIILARLKMTHDEMADAVDRINDNAMSSEQMQNIIEYLPTTDERKALESYMLSGGIDAAEKFDGLCECEKFMVAMMTVKYAKRKVQALMFKLQFGGCLQSLVNDTAIVETACDELSNSIRLRKLLGIVLNIGNRLNTAGVSSKQKAGAFKLESLLKLSHAKAFDKKTTFLHYIVLVVQRNNELLLRFKDDLSTVLKADKVYWDQCVSDLEEVENQLENVRRIALHQARLALAYRIKKNHSVNESGESLSDCSMSLEEEVELLRATPIGVFTLAAIKKVSTLRDKVETTKAKFKKLLEYFGEEDKQDMQPHELFNIMVTFCKDFEKAKEQVYDSTKKKMREDRKLQVSNKGIPPCPTPSSKPLISVSSKSPVRLSSLQPNMSSILKPYASDVQPNREAQYEPLTLRNGQHQRQSASRSIQSPTPLTISHHDSIQAPLQEGLDSSVDEFSDGGSFRHSPPISSNVVNDPNSSMRQKARIRRLRVSGRSSVSSSTSVTSSTTGTSFGSIVRLDPTTQPQQLSPRSSIRQRRRTEQRVGRGMGLERPDLAHLNESGLHAEVD